jgi:hypothetical protein
MGISASILCGIHCLLTPILVLASPLLGKFLSHQAFHLIVALVIYPIAIFALWAGYKIHNYRRMLALGGLGLVFVAAGIVAGLLNRSDHEPALMLAGGLFLIAAHALNIRACRVSSAPDQPPRPHDHSSAARASRTKPDSQVRENA